MEVCRWCMANFKSIGLELYKKYVVKRFSLFSEISKWRPNHMINHFLDSKFKVLHMEIVYANSHINRSATLWEEDFEILCLFYEKSKWQPNHVINQLFGLKLASASDVDGVCQISCQSVCNFMRRRTLKYLASFSENQNGSQTTWPTNFLGSNLKVCHM